MRRNRLFGNKLHLYAKRPLNCGIRTREQDRVYRLAYRLGYPIAKPIFDTCLLRKWAKLLI